MQWLAIILILSLTIGLRRRAGPAAHAFLVLGIAVVVGAWYVQLGHGG
jgi:hypothetical protein